MIAPVCPVQRPQPAPPARPARIPVPPMAFDLPSLIRSINISLDVLRTLTTSLTINNTWEARGTPGMMVYVISPYPQWSQTSTKKKDGYIYYKHTVNGEKKVEKDQRAHVIRTDEVEFVNTEQTSYKGTEYFKWGYVKTLDSDQYGPPPNG